MGMNRLKEAETFIRRALKIKQDANFYTNLGIVLASTKKSSEAVTAYRKSLTLNPDNAKACSNLGNLLNRIGDFNEAEALYRKATELEPNYAYGFANLGALLVQQKKYEEAEIVLRRGLALNSTLSKAIETLGTVLEKTKRLAEASSLFEKVGDWGRLVGNLRMRVAWRNLAEVDAAYINDLKSGRRDPVPPWSLLNVPAMTPQLQRKAALDFVNNKCGDVLQQPPLAVNSPARNGPLRIGYLSADYYDHATMHLLAGVLEAHDPGKVELHLLSASPRPARTNDKYMQRIAAMSATFHDLSSISDLEAAEQIAKIAPHLLIDLKGYTTDARPNITALRPAAVIVNWLGYPGTLGHERMADYIIGDPVVTPPDHAEHFSETLALMPHSYQPNDRSRTLEAPPSRTEAGLPETGFVFCCFNQFLKINPEMLDIWGRLLAEIPGSVLWLLQEHEEGKANLEYEAEKRGVSRDRLIFSARTSLANHLKRLQLADLALDTFPCNSHTTASDALWAGVPLVTRIGQTFASRVAASLLTAHGFPELIAPDNETYFQLVLSLVREPDKLRHIRQKLHAARLNSPLFDTVRFTRDLERLYEAIWQQQSIPRSERLPIVLSP